MGRITLVSVFILFTFLNCVGQTADSTLLNKAKETNTQIYYVKDYYKNGNMDYEGWAKKVVENSVDTSYEKVGIWKYYYHSGQIHNKVDYQFDKTDTVYETIYLKNGRIRREIKELSKLPLKRTDSWDSFSTVDEDWKFYSLKKYSNGVLIKQGCFVLGKKSGEWKWFGKNGRIKKVKVYKND
jgi:antitoxin component YwqK of YwqJK toxin-antitoxin module